MYRFSKVCFGHFSLQKGCLLGRVPRQMYAASCVILLISFAQAVTNSTADGEIKPSVRILTKPNSAFHWRNSALPSFLVHFQLLRSVDTDPKMAHIHHQASAPTRRNLSHEHQSPRGPVGLEKKEGEGAFCPCLLLRLLAWHLVSEGKGVFFISTPSLSCWGCVGLRDASDAWPPKWVQFQTFPVQ